MKHTSFYKHQFGCYKLEHRSIWYWMVWICYSCYFLLWLLFPVIHVVYIYILRLVIGSYELIIWICVFRIAPSVESNWKEFCRDVGGAMCAMLIQWTFLDVVELFSILWPSLKNESMGLFKMLKTRFPRTNHICRVI